MISGEIKQFGVCPFDKNHEIDIKKLLKHIEKCKSPTKQEYRGCPYNPYHWLHFEDIEKHKECKCIYIQLAPIKTVFMVK